MLLAFPPFTSSAVTGPDRLGPTAAQELFENVYLATFAWVLSASEIEPAATSVLCLSYVKREHAPLLRQRR